MIQRRYESFFASRTYAASGQLDVRAARAGEKERGGQSGHPPVARTGTPPLIAIRTVTLMTVALLT